MIGKKKLPRRYRGIQRRSPPSGSFAGCCPVCQPSQLPGEPEKTEAGDNRRLGAFSSKCKLSHLSAINQEVYGPAIFTL